MTARDHTDWFLKEWMAYLKIRQVDFVHKLDWSKGKANEIAHGKTKYNRELVNELANMMNLYPYELLMHPDDAMALRRLRLDLSRIANADVPLATPILRSISADLIPLRPVKKPK